MPPKAERVSSSKARKVSSVFFPLSLLGIISGILIVVGLFLPWTLLGSGWDIRRIGNYSYVILLGGIIALLGGLSALFSTKVKNIGGLTFLGGVVAFLGLLWAFADLTRIFADLTWIRFWSEYGFYLCLVGSILGVLGGIVTMFVGLKKLPSLIVAERVESKPTAAWYLVPFFLGILGGIIGYVVVKDEDKKMANNLLIFGIVITVIGAIIAGIIWGYVISAIRV